MHDLTHTTETNSARREVRRVLLITLALNLLVAFGKIMVGLATGALSITADGFHSLMDGASNLIGLIATRIAARPPDDDHPYGHARYETLAALGIGVLLLLTAWEIVSGAVERFLSGAAPELSPLAFAVLIVTLVINIGVSTYQRRAGRRLRSEILLADAANTRADVFVTLSVLGSMALVTFGWGWADPLAALIIVALIGRAAWDILRRTGGVLVDTAPFAPDQLRAYIAEVPSVARVVRARSRGPAAAAHIDIDIEVAPETTADHTAAITGAIRSKLCEKLGSVAEIEVHCVPQAATAPDYGLLARARADALGLATHEVRVCAGQAGKILELHVEVPPQQTLAAAHAQVSALEQAIHVSIPEICEVVTHIEPSQAAAAAPHPPICAPVDEALALLRAHYPALDWHDVRASGYSDEGCALTMHVTLPAALTVEAAHAIAEEAELLLRTHCPGIQRVTIHTEPAEPTAALAAPTNETADQAT
ncbi:MAG: cation-efflux pump [Chloroflexi bacterium]|nr:cation-efflux pump [Chloroflexota bacterium]